MLCFMVGSLVVGLIGFGGDARGNMLVRGVPFNQLEGNGAQRARCGQKAKSFPNISIVGAMVYMGGGWPRTYACALVAKVVLSRRMAMGCGMVRATSAAVDSALVEEVRMPPHHSTSTPTD